MNKALKVTFGTVVAVSMMAAATASAHEGDIAHRSAVYVSANNTKSTNNGLSVGEQLFVPPVGVLDNSSNHKFLDPESSWDWGVGFSYHIPHSQTRFFMHYDHYNDNNSNDDEVLVVRNFGDISPEVAGVQHRADEFRIGFNHMFRSTPRFSFNLGAFFEYDKVSRNINEIAADGGVVIGRDTYNQVKGWGPGVGVMTRATPSICHPSWGIFVGANTSMIYAENKYRQQAITNVAIPSTLVYSYNPDESHSLVGKLDISFGIDYARILCSDMGKVMFDVALGMRYMNMFNVFKNGNTAWSTSVYNATGFQPDFATYLGGSNDWGRMGPFIKFKIGGANA